MMHWRRFQWSMDFPLDLGQRRDQPDRPAFEGPEACASQALVVARAGVKFAALEARLGAR
jgi:hypothetical protein